MTTVILLQVAVAETAVMASMPLAILRLTVLFMDTAAAVVTTPAIPVILPEHEGPEEAVKVVLPVLPEPVLSVLSV